MGSQVTSVRPPVRQPRPPPGHQELLVPSAEHSLLNWGDHQVAAHLCFYTGKWLGHLCTLDSTCTCDSSVPTCVISGPPPVQPSLLTPASGIKLVHQGLCLAGVVPQIGFDLPKTSFPWIMVALTKQKSESKIYSFEQLFLLDLIAIQSQNFHIRFNCDPIL